MNDAEVEFGDLRDELEVEDVDDGFGREEHQAALEEKDMMQRGNLAR